MARERGANPAQRGLLARDQRRQGPVLRTRLPAGNRELREPAPPVRHVRRAVAHLGRAWVIPRDGPKRSAPQRSLTSPLEEPPRHPPAPPPRDPRPLRP